MKRPVPGDHVGLFDHRPDDARPRPRRPRGSSPGQASGHQARVRPTRAPRAEGGRPGRLQPSTATVISRLGNVGVPGDERPDPALQRVAARRCSPRAQARATRQASSRPACLPEQLLWSAAGLLPAAHELPRRGLVHRRVRAAQRGPSDRNPPRREDLLGELHVTRLAAVRRAHERDLGVAETEPLLARPRAAAASPGTAWPPTARRPAARRRRSAARTRAPFVATATTEPRCTDSTWEPRKTRARTGGAFVMAPIMGSEIGYPEGADAAE